jgi:hypothetical protein
MKKFAETVKKNGGVFLEARHRGKTTYEIQGLTSSPLIIFANWISPEDHQKVVEDLTNARSSITNLMAQLDYYKKDKRFEVMAEEILSLKSQLEKQQPEIPEFVATEIESIDFMGWVGRTTLARFTARALNWFEKNRGDMNIIEYIFKLYFIEYTISKPKTIVTPCPVCGFEDVENNFCGICGHKNEYVTAEEVEK